MGRCRGRCGAGRADRSSGQQGSQPIAENTRRLLFESSFIMFPVKCVRIGMKNGVIINVTAIRSGWVSKKIEFGCGER
jgi:hypothetical protein